MNWIKPVVLTGEWAVLTPLTREHATELQNAVSDGELWKLWYTKIPTPEQIPAEIERQLTLCQEGRMFPFAVVSKRTGQLLGMTTYMNIESQHRRLEIGTTWYRASAQRTAINTECKKLLLTHAFEILSCIAVEFRTSAMNFQSRKAIERLGAKLDGVLRSHQIFPNGTLRDTCVYSILAHEWPAVCAHLEWLLVKHGQ